MHSTIAFLLDMLEVPVVEYWCPGRNGIKMREPLGVSNTVDTWIQEGLTAGTVHKLKRVV